MRHLTLPVRFHDKSTREDEKVDPVEVKALRFGPGPSTPRLRVVGPERVSQRSDGSYDYDAGDMHSDGFMAVSSFAAVLRVLNLFEAGDILARPLHWSRRPGPLRLRVIDPLAGANAWYDPTDQQLVFGTFESGDSYRPLAESHDVIAHEMGHAVLDAVAPDLLDEVHLDCLAVHEAVADLVAFVTAIKHPELVRFAKFDTLDGDSMLNSLAEGFAQATYGTTGLRSLNNTACLPGGEGQLTDSAQPHARSQVLSGAIYQFARCFLQSALEDDDGETPMDKLATQLCRLLFRAIGYMPPGQITFLDFGRLISDVDLMIHPGNHSEMSHWARVLRERGILGPFDKLEQPHRPTLKPSAHLLESTGPALHGWLAANAEQLRIPQESELVECFDLNRHERYRWIEKVKRERVVKLRWVERDEDNGLAYQQGATVVISRDSRRIKLVTRTRGGDIDTQARARGLARARFGAAAVPRPPKLVQTPQGLRVLGLASMLHLGGHPLSRWQP